MGSAVMRSGGSAGGRTLVRTRREVSKNGLDVGPIVWMFLQVHVWHLGFWLGATGSDIAFSSAIITDGVRVVFFNVGPILVNAARRAWGRLAPVESGGSTTWP